MSKLNKKKLDPTILDEINKNKKERVTINLDIEQYERFKDKCFASRIKYGKMIDKLIEEFLNGK